MDLSNINRTISDNRRFVKDYQANPQAYQSPKNEAINEASMMEQMSSMMPMMMMFMMMQMMGGGNNMGGMMSGMMGGMNSPYTMPGSMSPYQPANYYRPELYQSPNQNPYTPILAGFERWLDGLVRGAGQYTGFDNQYFDSPAYTPQYMQPDYAPPQFFPPDYYGVDPYNQSPVYPQPEPFDYNVDNYYQNNNYTFGTNDRYLQQELDGMVQQLLNAPDDPNVERDMGQAMMYLLDQGPAEWCYPVCQCVARLVDEGRMNATPFIQGDYLARLAPERQAALSQAFGSIGLVSRDGQSMTEMSGYLLNCLSGDPQAPETQFAQDIMFQYWRQLGEDRAYPPQYRNWDSRDTRAVTSLLTLAGFDINTQGYLRGNPPFPLEPQYLLQ